MNYLVTGASGFVGQALCAGLAARGDSFGALSHSVHTLACGTVTQSVDLSSENFVTPSLEGVDVLYHLAGIAHQQATDEAYESVNHQATLRLARAASLAGVQHFVFLSSVKAMGTAQGTGEGTAGPLVERNELDVVPALDAYGRSKWLAEQGLRREFSGSSMRVTILRPALVYAEKAKGNLALLASGITWGLPRPPDEGGRSMIALPDLVELLLQLATRSNPGIATWIVTDGERYSTRRIYDALRAAKGKTRGVCWCPRWLWRAALWCLDIGRSRPESTWDKLFATEVYSSALVQRETHWRPQLNLEAAVAGAHEQP